MKKKTMIRLLAALAAAALLSACGASGGSSSQAAEDKAAYTAEADASYAEPAPDETAGAYDAGEAGAGSALDPQANTDRKIIYTAHLSMESTDFEAARSALLAAVESHGAYLEYTDQWGSAQDYDRYVSYTVRVPADEYRAFLAEAGEAASLLSMSESAEDITSSYIDVEARLSALESQRDRLNELADKAETTADLLEIESQLSEVQYQIENYTRQLRSMDNQVGYSTVDITLREVATLTPTGVTFGEKLTDAFTGGLNAFVGFVQGLVLTVVYLLPLLVVLAVLIPVLVVLYRRWRKAHPKKPRIPAPPATYGAETGDGEPKPKY